MFSWQIIICFNIIFLFLPIIAGNAQPNPPRAGVQFCAVLARIDGDLQLSPGLGLGGAFYVTITPQVKFQIEGETFRAHREFEVIGGGERLDVTLNSALLQFYATPFGNQEAVGLGLSLGMGVQQIIREEHQISLGARGALNIAKQRETSLLYSAGLLLNKTLNSRLSISISPQARFFSASGMKYSFYVRGGFGVGIL